MKLAIDRSVLLKSLSHMQSVVERRNTVEILSNIRIEAIGNTVSLHATDMDLEGHKRVSAVVTEEGVTTVPAHTLFDIVKKLPDGSQVEISCCDSDPQVCVRSGRSRFSLSCLCADHFPIMDNCNDPLASDGTSYSHVFRISARDLHTLIDRTRLAMSTDETRCYLNGIYLHKASSSGGDVLRAVATDGHRLARADTPLPREAETIPGLIIPKKTVSELHKLLDGSEDEVEISLSPVRIRFALGETVLTSRLIEGTYPDYEQVIPQDHEIRLEIPREPFLDAVGRVAIVAHDKNRTIRVSFDKSGLTLSASSTEKGDAQEEIECNHDVEPMVVGFNSRYLLDVMSQIQGENARVLMSDALSPAVVHECTDESVIYVLMPLRV